LDQSIMASRYSILLVLAATVSFALLGIYRIQQHIPIISIVSVTEDRGISRQRQEEAIAFAPDAHQQPKHLHHHQEEEEQVQPQKKKAVETAPAKEQDSPDHHHQKKKQKPPPSALFSQHKNPHNIRSWGCERRPEAPFIFVHCGKSGGGQVRARFAASALQFNRSTREWHKSLRDPLYYYPIRNVKTGKLSKGAFVNSAFPNFRPSYNETYPDDTPERWETFEGTLPCAAETPLGQALACPLLKRPPETKRACHADQCNIVYTGHNVLGNELHWLPNQYLSNWWNKWAPSHHHHHHHHQNVTEALLRRLDDWAYDLAPCYMPHHFNRSLQIARHYRSHYASCVRDKEVHWDMVAHEVGVVGQGNKEGPVTDWSPLYASLPVLRVILLREPLDWLVSKFFWHSVDPGYLMGMSGTKYTYNNTLKRCDNSEGGGVDDPLDIVADWVSRASLAYIHYLCGEDCIVRMHHGSMTLEQAEIQARNNLLQSFAVVGILEEQRTFYDMVTARTQYMNTSLHPTVVGSPHKSLPGDGVVDSQERCDSVFAANTPFARAITARSPELAALRRLYRVGLQVYQAQKDELEACGSLESNGARNELLAKQAIG
jgi:hypothetical protein